MPTKIINISLPADLVIELDAAAKANYSSRSDYIRESVVLRLKGQRIVEEWDNTTEELSDPEEE